MNDRACSWSISRCRSDAERDPGRLSVAATLQIAATSNRQCLGLTQRFSDAPNDFAVAFLENWIAEIPKGRCFALAF